MFRDSGATMNADDLTPGSLVGRYQLVAKLGEGAMGEVWKAMHLGLKKPVAIKVLKGEYAQATMARHRFLREGEAASRIRHPNVVEVHDVGLLDDLPYLVMEFLEGEDLATLLQREGVLPPRELADVMVPVLAAVSAAHEEGVVHRDLKPENVFLARNRDGALLPKVLDFGISRVVDDCSGRIRTGTSAVLGTPRYMSPEQARADRMIDDRSDQYSLGVILYECATGVGPFEDRVLFALLDKVARGVFAAPRSIRREVSERLEAIILRAMSLRPADRFASVREMGAALLPLASERTRVLWAPTFERPSDASHPHTSVDFETLAIADGRASEVTLPIEPHDTIVDAPAEGESTTLPLAEKLPRARVALVVFAGVVAFTLATLAVIVSLRR